MLNGIFKDEIKERPRQVAVKSIPVMQRISQMSSFNNNKIIGSTNAVPTEKKSMRPNCANPTLLSPGIVSSFNDEGNNSNELQPLPVCLPGNNIIGGMYDL